MGMGIVMQTLRIAIVGTLSGPDILGVINVIGKKSTLGRLKQLRNHNLN
jgi:glutamyl/glutaminyl-tRNA synthetase